MSDKTRIENKLQRKTNPELRETILAAKKGTKWLEVANLVSRPKRVSIKVNLDSIEKNSKEGDIIVIPGKVLGKGNLTKKIKVVAFSFSESVDEKLDKAKCEKIRIIDEIKKNPEAKNIKILTE